MPAHLDGKEENWLLIKRRDDGRRTAVGQRDATRPMLATLDDALPPGDGWLYEVKFDGYRALAYVRGGECTLVSRNDNDLTGRFPEVAKAIVKAVEDPERRPRRRDLPRSTRRAGRASPSCSRAPGPLVYYAFDLLELDGEPLVDLPLDRAQGAAAELLDGRVTHRRASPRASTTATALFDGGAASRGSRA